MKLLQTPQGADPIAERKKLNDILRQAQTDSKPDSCILCGRKVTSFCNSHSVPQMVLKNIADNGKILQSNILVGVEMQDIEKGINNSGTFHFICNDCDSKYFQDYENPDHLKSCPTDKMMAEIALKDALIQLWKRMQEMEIIKKAKKSGVFVNPSSYEYAKNLDIKENKEEIDFYKNIIENNIQNGFQILFWTILPFKTHIAVETGFALSEDLNGHQVNNLFDLRPDIRIQNMHLCVFPLENESIVLAFYHKRDKKYHALRHQFNSVSKEIVLEYLNWLIFKYSENYFISKDIRKLIEGNEKLQELSQENLGYPNMGMVTPFTLLTGYRSVNKDEIPNFLSSCFEVK